MVHSYSLLLYLGTPELLLACDVRSMKLIFAKIHAYNKNNNNNTVHGEREYKKMKSNIQ